MMGGQQGGNIEEGGEGGEGGGAGEAGEEGGEGGEEGESGEGERGDDTEHDEIVQEEHQQLRFELALQYYQAAAARGDAEATFNLGMLHQRGHGVVR
jgi:TPR repeat protein